MTILTRAELAGRSLARKYLSRKPDPTPRYDPYDKAACVAKADALLAEMRNEPGKEPLERCQRILSIIAVSYPTDALAAEYFSNLDILLDRAPRLETPGQLVIGLGPGRCGSTSLAAMLATVGNSCCTHETPPPIFWDPGNEQMDFHIRRFRMLAGRYALVADVSHWWLNAIGRVFREIPQAKAVGLIRDPDDCALSFMRIQGFGKGSFNPWAAHGNGYWRAGHWDPTYPSYPLPGDAGKNPDRAKLELIKRYVTEYNGQLETLARTVPDRVMLVRTEDLSKDSIQEEIFRIAKAHGRTAAWKLNVKNNNDGKENQIRF